MEVSSIHETLNQQEIFSQNHGTRFNGRCNTIGKFALQTAFIFAKRKIGDSTEMNTNLSNAGVISNFIFAGSVTIIVKGVERSTLRQS